MKKYFIIAFTLGVVSLFAYPNSEIIFNEQSKVQNKDTFLIMKKDSLYLIIKPAKESVKSFDYQKNMPWIGAVLVGILTVLANILINKQSRESNRKVNEMQLNNSKEIALAQIENARKNAQMEFNKTVLSGNRQIWINDLREIISKILSSTMSISVKENLLAQEFENLRFLITKAELMLNFIDDKDFIFALTELENCCLEILMKNKNISDLKEYTEQVKNHAQIKIKTEWERVKKGE